MQQFSTLACLAWHPKHLSTSFVGLLVHASETLWRLVSHIAARALDQAVLEEKRGRKVDLLMN
jgi:hypothetical protein